MGAQYLDDPEELIVRFYFVVDQTFHIYKDEIIDLYGIHRLSYPALIELQNLHSGLFNGVRPKPLSELSLLRSAVRHTNTHLTETEIGTWRLAMEVFKGDVKLSGRADHFEDLRGASVFVVSVHLDTLHLLSTRLRSEILPYNYVRSSEQVTDVILQVAFDEAVHHVREISKTSYKLARNTVHPFTEKLLEPQIPFAVLRNNKANSILRTGFWSNEARLSVLREESRPRADNDLTDFEAGDQQGPFDDHLDLFQEAQAAYARGLNRSAVVMLASAVENLFNTLLQLLNWERGEYPEVNAEEWDEKLSIIARVKSDFSPLLGGQWTIDKSVALSEWSTQVVDLRNDVAHGSRVPSDPEIDNAFQSVESLLADLIDRLTNQRNKKRFARTAFMLAGEQGLEKRGIDLRYLRQLQQDSTESDWRHSAELWMHHHLGWLQKRRLGWDLETQTERVMVIRREDLHIAAYEHAPSMTWAREIINLNELINQIPDHGLIDILNNTNWSEAAEYLLINMTNLSLTGLKFSEKLPSYRLVPFSRITPGYNLPPQLNFIPSTANSTR